MTKDIDKTGLPQSKIEAIDDGRTIADMSGVGGSREQMRELFGDFRRSRREIEQPSAMQPQMDKEDRRAYLFGAMGAALTIALIFIGAAALVIFLMLLFWGAL